MTPFDPDGPNPGSASVLEFALRHPDRVIGLLLANARLGGPTPNKLLEPVQRAVYGWERLWWVYRKLLPSTYARMVGFPRATS
jgi:pimeloyl-ACP methyl ester carboxylesterase